MTYELRPQVLDDVLAYLIHLIAGYPPLDPRTAQVRAQIDAIRKAQAIILAYHLLAPMLISQADIDPGDRIGAFRND